MADRYNLLVINLLLLENRHMNLFHAIVSAAAVLIFMTVVAGIAVLILLLLFR